MILNEKRDVNSILKELLNKDSSLTLKYQKSRITPTHLITIAAIEKRMLRTGQIATASLLFITGDNATSLDIITSGGGKGAFDISDSVNKAFYTKLIEEFTAIGFVEEDVDIYQF